MFDDYFIQEEFIFPEEGGVTGTSYVHCPHCGVLLEIEVDVGNQHDCCRCCDCSGRFAVDWVKEVVSKL